MEGIVTSNQILMHIKEIFSVGRTEISLTSGCRAVLGRPKSPSTKEYHVLYFPESQGLPNQEDQNEMLVLANLFAKALSEHYFGDPECFMIIHNGLGTRRERNYHYHIIPIANRLGKILVYSLLSLKNIFYPIWRATKIARPRV